MDLVPHEELFMYFGITFSLTLFSYLALHYIAQMSSKFYQEKTNQEQIKWRYMIVGLIGHIVTSAWVVLTFKDLCPEKGDFAWFSD